MLAWQIWLIIGIICVIIEIFDPMFFFLSLGIGGILTGALSLIIKSTALQILIFAIISFLAFLSMRKLGKKILTHHGGETNVYALKGKHAIVVKTIEKNGKGYVKVGGEEWSAIEANHGTIPEGSKVIVVGVDGNKLLVELSADTPAEQGDQPDSV